MEERWVTFLKDHSLALYAEMMSSVGQTIRAKDKEIRSLQVRAEAAENTLEAVREIRRWKMHATICGEKHPYPVASMTTSLDGKWVSYDDINDILDAGKGES